MTKIFISYRRDDAEADAGRLYDKLKNSPRIDSVFFDHESIKKGTNFIAKINQALEGIDVVLVIINKSWCRSFRKRIKQTMENTVDYVHHEISQAIQLNKIVIPIVIGNTKFPTVNQLPEDLKPLADLNAIWIKHSDFNRDVDELIKTIDELRLSINRNSNENYEEEIWEKYNRRFMASMSGEDYQIRWYYSSETAPDTLCGSHKLTEMLEHLIEEAGIDWWIKHDDELRPEEFWLRILKAVATSCRIDYPLDDEFERSDADFIRDFLPELEGINSFWLNSKAYKLTQRVAEAFSDTQPKVFEKLTSEYFDDEPELIKTFRGQKWSSITHEQIEQFLYSLSTFDPKVAVIYLPAYLTTALKQKREISGAVFDILSPDKGIMPAQEEWLDLLVKGLNHHQRNVVHQFMEWCTEEAFDDETEKAVEYWEKVVAKSDR